MITGLLHLHNFGRWIVLGLALWAILRYILGWTGKKAFTATDEKASLFYMISMDTMLLVGGALYFLKGWYAQMGNMADKVVRFWAVEHIFTMLIALVLVHIGRSKMKKAADDNTKFRLGFIFFGISLLLVLSRIPWPFYEIGIGRALFPGMQP